MEARRTINETVEATDTDGYPATQAGRQYLMDLRERRHASYLEALRTAPTKLDHMRRELANGTLPAYVQMKYQASDRELQQAQTLAGSPPQTQTEERQEDPGSDEDAVRTNTVDDAPF